MADREEETPDQNELKIPVFTVLKNGAILKNIFIVNNVADRVNEEIITLGRHPDCNIMLTHPSISRFHLQIHSNPSSQKLYVVDLSSVHGTWVSGKRIETGDRVEMREGDILRVGGSSRVYRLHWVPLSCAYDFEGPKEKKEHEIAIVEEMAVKDCEKEISLLDEIKETVVDSVFGSIEPLYPDENWNMELMERVPLAPQLSEVEEMAVSSVDHVEGASDSRTEYEQVETSLLSIPFGNELKGLEMSFQPPSLPLSADNLSFNVENIIMSSFFGSDNKSSSSSTNDTSSIWNIPSENISRNYLYENQQCHSDPSLPLSAENLSFNVENIIMSSFFDGESKSSPCNMFEWKETGSTCTIPLENKSNILSVVDDIEATPEYDYQQLLDENIPQPHSTSLYKENSSDVQDTALTAFSDGEWESPSRNKFEEKEISNITTMPLGHELSQVTVVEDEMAISNNESQRFVAERNLSSNFADADETQDLPAHEVKSSSTEPLLALQSETVTEENEFIVEHELHPLEDDDSSISIEKGIQEIEMVIKIQAEGGEDYADKGNGELYHQVTDCFLDCLSEYENVSSVKATSEVTPNSLMKQNVESCVEEKCNVRLETLEPSKSSISGEDSDHKELSEPSFIPCAIEHVYSSRPGEEVPPEIVVKKECQTSHGNLEVTLPIRSENASAMEGNIWLRRGKPSTFPRIETLKPSKSNVPEEDYEHKELLEPSFIPSAIEYVYSSLLDEEVLPEIAVEKECQTPHENLEVNLPLRSESASAMGGNIWLRRGKPTSFPQIETGVSRTNRVGTLLMDEMNHEIAGDKSVTNTLFHLGEEEEEEIFTPDKENFTPNTLLMKSLKKKASIEDSGNCFRSSKSQKSIFKSRHKAELEEPSEESDKENQTPRVLQEQKLSKQISRNRRFEQENTTTKKVGAERAPFQSLQSNIARKKRPEATVVKKSARKSNISVCTGAMKNKFTVEGKKRWTMVVDTNSLLNKESMKSLQLLEALQGTHLIIPRIVIRELDCLKRNGSLFRKTTEAASVLQWIEDCMVQTKWWIHVQSSEEGVPPMTPPATPQSCSQSLFWRTRSSIQSITQRSFMEALSPTPEDHILDCALHYRRGKGVNHGQLVLISNDVTLKIKAMAEGLICETAKEFRESLVNPFSDRFLWADSSPRGLTWSCPDDMVLRERYDRCSSRLSKGAEGAKGLKLILLHNSHYAMFR